MVDKWAFWSHKPTFKASRSCQQRPAVSSLIWIKVLINLKWDLQGMQHYTVKHAKFASWNLDELEALGIFPKYKLHLVSIYTFWGRCQLFFAWRLLKQLQRCDGLKFGQLKAHLFTQEKNQSTHYFERCYKPIVCSFTLDAFFLQPQKLSTWFFTPLERGESPLSVFATLNFSWICSAS